MSARRRLCEVGRIQEAITRHGGVCRTRFSRRANRYSERKANKFERYAARFARKKRYEGAGKGCAAAWMARSGVTNLPSGVPR